MMVDFIHTKTFATLDAKVFHFQTIQTHHDCKGI